MPLMKERLATITTSRGAMEAFIAHPRESAPFSAVIVYMDIWGMREELFDIARRIGTAGYYCVVPDLYHAQGRIRNEFRNEENRTISYTRLTKDQQEKVMGPRRKLTDAMVVDDTSSILDFIRNGEPVRDGPLGCVGFCMGGRHALRIAAELSSHFRACACLHGTSLVTSEPDSLHLTVGNAKGEIYCGFAELDPDGSRETIETISRSLRNSEARFNYELHEGAEHGYALPDRDIHDKAAADRDWEHIFAMFRRQLQ